MAELIVVSGVELVEGRRAPRVRGVCGAGSELVFHSDIQRATGHGPPPAEGGEPGFGGEIGGSDLAALERRFQAVLHAAGKRSRPMKAVSVDADLVRAIL